MGEHIYIAFKKIFLNKSCLWNLKVVRKHKWAQVRIVNAKIDLCNNLKFKFLTGRRLWLISLTITDLAISLNELLHLTNIYINWQVQLRTYRGQRHFKRLPVYGQRTRSNAKSCKWQYLRQNVE